MLLLIYLTILSLSYLHPAQAVPFPAGKNTNNYLNAFNKLNRATHGRLHTAYPFAKPCFSTYEGHPSPSSPAACAVIQANYTSSAYRTTFYNGFMHSYNEICASSSSPITSQCLLDPSNPSPPALNASCGQGSVSRHYIDVRSASDIQAALLFSHKTGTRLSIKNSGHDYAGRSSLRDSLALWTRNLQNMEYHPSFVPQGCDSDSSQAFQAITVGAGVNFNEVYHFADAHNVTFVGGSSPTVGASGGFTMSGGHGLLSSQYGLGVDRVLEFKVVTGDGEVRVANRCQNEDLFWALRGAGGGTFGVVLESTSRVETGRPLVMAYVMMPAAANSSETEGFVELLMGNAVRWADEGWGGPNGLNYVAMVNPFVSVAEAEKSMQPVTEYARAHGGSVTIESLPSFLAVYEKYVAPTANTEIGTASVATNRMIPTAMLESEEGRATIHKLLGVLAEAGLSPTLFATTPAYYSARHPEAAHETSAHPAWRSSTWMITTEKAWAWNATLAERRAFVQKMKRVTSEMEDLVPDSGSYLAEAYPWTADWRRAWWGENYNRLMEIKDRYDPEGMLGCWRCVGWREKSQQAGQAYACMGGLDGDED